MATSLPGVTVRIANQAGIIAPPVYERYPVIIGEGDPYRLQENVRVVRSLGSVDSIPCITTINAIVSVGDLPGVASYTSGTDYSLVAGGNAISWIPGGDSPTAGDNFYITFTETRPTSAYTPMLYFDENLIYADHGNRTRTNAAINDVSVGGSLALNAGAKGVIIAQLNLSAATNPNSPSATELENAFIAMRNELNKITGYKLFLVPMSSGTLNSTSANNIFFNHAVIASQPERKQERTVIGCLAQNQTYLQAATYAQTFSHERMVIPYAYNSTSQPLGFSTTYDMRFYNAALAGKLCSVGVGIGIADEIVPNITILDNHTPDEFEYLVQNNVSPAKVSGDVVRNIMAITTDGTNALTESLGIQDIKDYVKKYWREGLWAIYRNAPITTALLGAMTATSEATMRYLQFQNVISDYRNISVAQDPAEPRKINLTADVLPVYGVTWMDVTFVFSLSFS